MERNIATEKIKDNNGKVIGRKWHGLIRKKWHKKWKDVITFHRIEDVWNWLGIY